MKIRLAQKNNSGFTLIELVIVVAIIAVIGASIFTIIDPFELQKSSRDSVRVSNLNSIAQALELYFAQTKSYPDLLDGTSVSGKAARTELSKINSRINWTDPSGCQVVYKKTASGYRLYFIKESKSFTVPSGQNLVSIISNSGLYDLNTFCPNGVSSQNNQVIMLQVN